MNKILVLFLMVLTGVFIFGCAASDDSSSGEPASSEDENIDDLESEAEGINEDLGTEDFDELDDELDELDSLDI